MKQTKWHTVLSDLRWGTNYVCLHSTCNTLVMELVGGGEIGAADRYEVRLETDCEFAYRVTDEEFEVPFVINALEMRWTFIVEGAPFASLADWKLEEYERVGITRPYVHYVICAYDVTLEIISNTEPVIRKVE